VNGASSQIVPYGHLTLAHISTTLHTPTLNNFTMTIKLTKFRILETGADGGHSYVTSDIVYKGQTRKIVVFFADKSDERKLKEKTEITVEGDLIEEKDQSLNLSNSRLIE
jgi:hypothetical protein